VAYSPEAEDHLWGLTARQRRVVVDSISQQLRHQPNVETRNRRRMRPSPLAPWELRVGDFRVYYDIEQKERVVHIRAVGVKDRNLVRIGNEVIEP
jgi:mRNA-degrading endonuclease RelE of RelBE toxin-antitoxin system